MSELEIYIQEQSENDKNLKEIQIQRSRDDGQQTSNLDGSKVQLFLQKMNLKSLDSNLLIPGSCNQSSKHKNHNSNLNFTTKSQEVLQPLSPKQNSAQQTQQTGESKRVKASIAMLQSQDIQTSFFQQQTLIGESSEYELCKNILKKPKSERNDKDLSVLQITLGNNLEFLQKYKTFLPMKSFKDLLFQFEYQECQPFEQILNIESKSNKIFFLLKGELAIFIPRIEKLECNDNNNLTQIPSDKNSQTVSKINLRKSQTQIDLKPQIKINEQIQTNQTVQEKSESKRRSISNQGKVLNTKSSSISMINILDDQEIYKENDINKVKQNFQKDMEEKFQNFMLLKFAKVGDMFGETSLEYRYPELYSVVCVTKCEFAVIQPSSYYKYFAHKFFLLHLESDKMFRKTQLFYNWPQYCIYEFSKISQRHQYKMHDVIFNIGEQINKIYFFCSGMIHKLQPLYQNQDIQSQVTKQNNQKAKKQQLQLGTKIEVINSVSVFGEEGILDQNETKLINKREYQVVCKKDETVVYSIEKKLFQLVYNYFAAKEGLDSYEQQQEKKKRKFLDSIYRSIRQMERIQILEKTIDEIKRQKQKENRRKQLQREQVLNENQILYAVTNDDLDHIQLNHYLKHQLEDQIGEKITNNQIKDKKRSFSQTSKRQNQTFYNITNFHFTEKELRKYKQMQINKIDKTLNQEMQIKDENNNNQILIVKDDLIQNPQHLNGENLQQQITIQNNQNPSQKLEQIKYNVIAQHLYQFELNKPQNNNSQSIQNSKNQSFVLGSKKAKFQNGDKYNIQKFPLQQQQYLVDRNVSKTELKSQSNKDLENSSNKIVEFSAGEKQEISMNELNKAEQQNNIQNKTSRLLKVNYNHYKNIIQNVNKSQKINNFYDENKNESDLFKNTSVFFEKSEQENVQTLPSSAIKSRNQSQEKKDNQQSPFSQQLKKTPFQKYKENSDEVKKIIRIRRSKSEKKYDFSIKTKGFDIPSINIVSQQASQQNIHQQQQQQANNSSSINTSFVGFNPEQSHKANMSALSALINLKLMNQQVSNLNIQDQIDQNNQLSTSEQIEKSLDNFYRKQSSPLPNYKQNKAMSMHQTIEEFNFKKILNSPKLHQIDLTMNAQSINKVFKNTLKLKSWHNSKIKNSKTNNQGNQTDLKYPSQQQHSQINSEQMKSLSNHIQNFEFYAKCKNGNPYNIYDGDVFQDFISRPVTAAAAQNIISKKTLIKDLMKQTQIKQYMIVQQKNVNNQIQL
ncbi:cyclic nucleotide-binding domain protein (macronuclear) [Tetrahymena thermophila SB210]|uniref:Cyclic nucleotide-binding domain protein n=1 Tax=Tetrahymena thermophila (strain SB210) TaxID=312017 RepID=I7MHG0_TETTS|nr:cyclic nucleotide-binding domain protein [Tetrahymena thermophila SB210]EAR87502.1 cyclic nucleotide-binding domain protein [Tetrahymena thermophila SB210]|eukprot:XP_001007747.1 cyclic nucleotide-binding domain protein [Tetrahymena thermophila SB210]